jgi:hypothetical protein
MAGGGTAGLGRLRAGEPNDAIRTGAASGATSDARAATCTGIGLSGLEAETEAAAARPNGTGCEIG